MVVCRNIEEVSQRKQEFCRFSGEANKTMRMDNRIMIIIMRTKTKTDLPIFPFESHLVSSKASPQRAKLDKPDNLPSDSRTPGKYIIVFVLSRAAQPSGKSDEGKDNDYFICVIVIVIVMCVIVLSCQEPHSHLENPMRGGGSKMEVNP